MKVFKIRVDACAVCPAAMAYRCGLKDMRVIATYIDDVPDWCPLEDEINELP